MRLGQSCLTELRLLKVLADHMVEPFISSYSSPRYILPRFTVRAGDLGITKGGEEDDLEWEDDIGWQVLEASKRADEMVSLNCSLMSVGLI